jgi:hypothetical protein
VTTLSHKGAKSRTRITRLRSKTTKARTHVDRIREPRAGLEKKLEARTRELSEAREQRAATAEVLRIISSSPGDLEPVFQAMLANAMRICEAKFGIMFGYADGAFRALSSQGGPPALLVEEPHIVSEHPHNPLTRVARTKEVPHSRLDRRPSLPRATNAPTRRPADAIDG